MGNDYCVYSHTSPSGKTYVGITNQMPASKRWKNGRGYYHNQYFQSSINKYGWENFSHEILFSGLDSDSAMSKEIETIRKLKSNQGNYGYNLTDGGGGRIGMPHTEETKRKMRLAAIGKPKSAEHRASISRANIIRFRDPFQRSRLCGLQIGRKTSDSTKKKLSERHKGFIYSEKSKIKMSNSAIKSWTPDRHTSSGKSIDQYDLDNNYIQSFSNAVEAGTVLNVSSCHISSCCHGKRKTSNKFIWRFSNEQK